MRPIVGVWILKAATINGRAATANDLSGLLAKHGGAELGMLYKFRPAEGDYVGCSLNDVLQEYRYHYETKELIVKREGNSEREEAQQAFDLRFVGKDMKLRFRESGKVIDLLFTPDE